MPIANKKSKKLGGFRIMKFQSARLKNANYELEITEAQATRNGEVIKLGENELLSSIQKIRNREVDFARVDKLEDEKRRVGRKRNSDLNREKIRNINEALSTLTFIPDLISIVFSDKRHYQNIIDNGLRINNKPYVRILAGAGNIRRNTVFFIQQDMAGRLTRKLNAGRDMEINLNPAKLSAYFGLYGSAGHSVPSPRMAVIPDYHHERLARLHWIDENDRVEDVERDIVLNAFDGQGLISPHWAKVWAVELGIDYIPSSFIFRAPFVKGQLVTFDFHSFAQENSEGTATDIWGDIFHISEVDIIVSESQFKMGSSYSSITQYIEEMEKRELGFRISRHSPRTLKNLTSTNYMFLQVLDLDEQGVEDICSSTENFFTDIMERDPQKTVLAMSGTSVFSEDFDGDTFDGLDVISKGILIYPKLLSERYFSQRIKTAFEKKERQAKLGKLFVGGNYTPIVSDPYAQAEWLCGIEPVGLLKEDEHFSEYWNILGINTVACARSPLTHNSEMITAKLVMSRRMERYYRYLDTVFILPFNGLDTLYEADAD